MSIRVDTASLISGAIVCGHRGLGVLGSQIASSGTHGPGYVYPSLDLPGDNDKEYRGLIVTPPSSGTLVAGEDSSFLLIGASDGEYSLVFRLFEDGADLGLVTATFNVGPVSLAGAAAMQATASGALQVLRNLQAAAAGGGQAAGQLAHGVPLGAAASAQVTGSGELSLIVRLAAASVGGAGATGALNTSTGLAAAAFGQGLASGQLSLSIALAGAALAAAAASGEFTGQVSLAGNAAAAAGVQGELAISVPLGATAAAMVSSSGALVISVLLGGAAQGSALAQGSMLGDVILSGAAGGSVTVVGTLAVYTPAVGTVRVHSVAGENRVRQIEPQTRILGFDEQGRSYTP